MKKLFTLFLTLFVASSVWAYDFEVDGIYYTFDSMSETVAVTYGYYSGYSDNVTIPSSVTYNGNSYSVTSIGGSAFNNCSGLTSVTIPNSVTSIGGSAFSGCSGLTSVTIPNSVTSIGGSAFNNCSGLTSVTIPNGVTSIGGSAFSGCSGLTSVTIPNSVTSIGGSAFSGCSGLTSVTIPNGVTSIGNGAFSSCSSLTSVTIPNSVTSIGDYAFEGCKSLPSVTIPNSVTSIGGSAFYGCSGLTSITIPNSVTSIGYRAFMGCSGLTAVTIPDGLDVYNAGLEFTKDNMCYKVLNSKEVSVSAYDYPTGDIIIPSTVTIVGNTFAVTSIEYYAFSGCIGLTSVTIPNSVTSIENHAFYGCIGLTSVTIPNSVTSIGESAFSGCSNLKTLIIKNGTCSIEGDLSTCTALTEYSGPADPFNKYNSSEPGSFSTLLEKITLTSGVLDRNGLDYINLSYRTLQEIDLSGIENTNIPDMAFNNCYKLEKVTLPTQLESVGYKSFAGCTALKGISLPATVTKIDNSAFEDCRKLEQILFDGSELKASTSNLETIGDWAFYNCHNLKSLEVPEGVISIGDAAFYGCTYLQDLKLPSTLKSMGDNTFALCENLKSMTILAENPPSLYEKSFYNVDHTIPVSVPESSLKAYAETEYWSEFIHYKSADEQGGGQGGSTAVSEVSNATAVTIVNGQILVNGEAPAFVVTVSGQKIANANLKAGVYFVVVDGKTVGVSVR
ncbi:MAG: leucine-rich repeat domain-containing protein [Bacteroidales bacterium]|nr:leucine-rich repeat domain-containing protein [Bacteroidales bacterium]